MRGRIVGIATVTIVGTILALNQIAPSQAHPSNAPCRSCNCYTCDPGGPFSARVLIGPDRGLTLAGDLKLYHHGANGNLAGTLRLPSGASIKVTGQHTGFAISMFIHLGPGKNIFGTGVIGYDPTRKRTVLGGTFSGPRESDFGTWAKAE
ncbi:MAG: hypothetical protein JOZ41_20765 [Chloroflexi bacterium]|nr:hypothetical protein [Chloroflexota bacterium]